MTRLQGFVRDSAGSNTQRAGHGAERKTGSSKTRQIHRACIASTTFQRVTSPLCVDARVSTFSVKQLLSGNGSDEQIDAVEVGVRRSVTVSASTPTVETQVRPFPPEKLCRRRTLSQAQGTRRQFQYKLKQKITPAKTSQPGSILSQRSKQKSNPPDSRTENHCALSGSRTQRSPSMAVPNHSDSDAFAGEACSKQFILMSAVDFYAADPAVRVVDRMQRKEKPVSRVPRRMPLTAPSSSNQKFCLATRHLSAGVDPRRPTRMWSVRSQEALRQPSCRRRQIGRIAGRGVQPSGHSL